MLKDCVIVELSLSAWTGSKKDKVQTEKVLSEAGAQKDAGAFRTYLIPSKAMSIVTSAISNATRVHQRWTTPYLTPKARLLSLANWESYTNEMRPAKARFDKACDDFCFKDYQLIVDRRTERLGTLAANNLYPTAQWIRNRFGFFLSARQADVGTGIPGVTSTESNVLQLANILHVAKLAITEIGHYADRLHGERVFRDSLVPNLAKRLTMFRQMLCVPDTEIETILGAVTPTLTDTESAVLRVDTKRRSEKLSAANKAVESLRAVYNGLIEQDMAVTSNDDLFTGHPPMAIHWNETDNEEAAE